MKLTFSQTLITIVVIAFGTLLTRFLPFWLFPENKKVPKFVTYLGTVLPAAMMGLLVIYSFKDVVFKTYPYGIPNLIATFFIVVIHKWKKNVLLSIGGGTALYMILIRIF